MAINAKDFKILGSIERLKTMNIGMVYPGHGRKISYERI